MSSDNDPLFRYFQWKANMRIYEIKKIKSIQPIYQTLRGMPENILYSHFFSRDERLM